MAASKREFGECWNERLVIQILPPHSTFRSRNFLSEPVELPLLPRHKSLPVSYTHLVKPSAATARPVNEFNSEMTTGMSAPPMGMTIAMPKNSASKNITPNAVVAWLAEELIVR